MIKSRADETSPEGAALQATTEALEVSKQSPGVVVERVKTPPRPFSSYIPQTKELNVRILSSVELFDSLVLATTDGDYLYNRRTKKLRRL